MSSIAAKPSPWATPNSMTLMAGKPSIRPSLTASYIPWAYQGRSNASNAIRNSNDPSENFFKNARINVSGSSMALANLAVLGIIIGLPARHPELEAAFDRDVRADAVLRTRPSYASPRVLREFFSEQFYHQDLPRWIADE